MMISKRYIVAFLFLSLFIFPRFAEAQSFNKIYYYTEGKKSLASFQKNAKDIDIVAPQIYSVNSAGDLKGGPNDDFMLTVAKYHVKVMPLLINGGFSSTTLGKILDNPTLQDKIVQEMIAEAKNYGYVGWQFDFEQMSADYRDRYSAFARRAYPEFKKNNLIFSVAVIAQTSLNPADYPKNLWQRVVGAYDYKALGQNSDFLSIMSYDQADSTGPVAGLPWVKKVIKFAIGQVPAKKISLGIPFYFWKWDDRTGKLVDIGGYGRVAELSQNDTQVVKWGWDPDLQVAYVDYFKNHKKYTAWYENAKSFSRKLDLAMLYGLHGFSAWTLGLEDPKVYGVTRARAI